MSIRKIEKLENDEWVECKMKDLKKGNKFRLYDDEKPVIVGGESVFDAIGDPYLNEIDEWEIEVKDIEKK